MSFFHSLEIDHLKGYLIFLDIDGTLIHDSKHELDEEVIKKINILKKNNEVYLCSNSSDYSRNRKVSELSGLPYLETTLRKPSKKMLHLVDEAGGKKRLVIGDKLLTDGLFALNIGAKFMKVKRMTSTQDSRYIKFLYWVDDVISKMLKI